MVFFDTGSGCEVHWSLISKKLCQILHLHVLSGAFVGHALPKKHIIHYTHYTLCIIRGDKWYTV